MHCLFYIFFRHSFNGLVNPKEIEILIKNLSSDDIRSNSLKTKYLVRGLYTYLVDCFLSFRINEQDVLFILNAIEDWSNSLNTLDCDFANGNSYLCFMKIFSNLAPVSFTEFHCRRLFLLISYAADKISTRKGNRKKMGIVWKEKDKSIVLPFLKRFCELLAHYKFSYIEAKYPCEGPVGPEIDDVMKIAMKGLLALLKNFGEAYLKDMFREDLRDMNSKPLAEESLVLPFGNVTFFFVVALRDGLFARDVLLLMAVAVCELAKMFSASRCGIFIALGICVGETKVKEILSQEVMRNCSDFISSVLNINATSVLFSNSTPQVSRFGKLALLRAGIAIWSDEDLFCNTNFDFKVNSIGFDVIVETLLSYTGESSDSNFRYLVFNSLFIMFERMTANLKGDEVNRIIEKLFHLHFNVNSRFVNLIMAKVRQVWDDPVDGVANEMRGVFVCMLKLMSSSNENNELCLYLRSFTRELGALDWHIKGKYAIIRRMIPYIGIKNLIDDIPTLKFDLEKCLNILDMVHCSAEVYEEIVRVLSRPPKTLLTKNHVDSQEVIEVWWDSFGHMVLMSLCNKEEQFRSRASAYWLKPTLSYLPASLEALYNGIELIPVENQVWCYILLFRIARSIGFINGCGKVLGAAKSACNGQELNIKGPLSKALLEDEESIRLEAFNFICISKKAEIVSDYEILFMKMFLPLNINSISKGFRQLLGCGLKRFLVRLFDSLLSLGKKLKKKDDALQRVQFNECRKFVPWIWSFSCSNLYPDASYQRRVSALSIMKFVLEVFCNSQVDFDKFGEFGDVLSREWSFVSRDSLVLLLANFECSYVEVRERAFDIVLSNFSSSELAYLWNSDLCMELSEKSFKLISSPRPHASGIGSSYFKVLFSAVISKQNRSIPIASKSANETVRIECFAEDKRLETLEKLVKLLLFQFTHCKADICNGLGEHPLHGTLRSLAEIMTLIDFEALYKNFKFEQTPDSKAAFEKWSEVINDLFDIVLKVLAFISSVLISGKVELEGRTCSKSKKQKMEVGNLPSFADVESSIDDVIMLADSSEDKGFERELVALCCWLVVKEGCTFIGNAFRVLPAVNTKGNLSLQDTPFLFMTVERCEEIFDAVFSIMMQSRHRGIIEAANASLSMVFSKCFSSFDSRIQNYPTVKLMSVMNELESFGKMASVTRRSAGVPYIVENVLCSMSGQLRFSTLEEIMKMLFRICESPVPAYYDEKVDLPQVHGLNVLRVLIRNSTLGKDILQYCAEGLRISLNLLCTESWTIRNGATMLYSAIVSRIVGSKKSSDENASLNSISVEDIYIRYPGVLDTLYNHLTGPKKWGKDKYLCEHPSLYPTVVLLSKLFSKDLEISRDKNEIMAFERKRRLFVEELFKCCESPIFHVRVMASKAIVPFVPVGDREAVLLKRLLDQFDSIEHIPANRRHGMLLSVQNFLREFPKLFSGEFEYEQKLEKIVWPWISGTARVLFNSLEKSAEFVCISVFVEICIEFFANRLFKKSNAELGICLENLVLNVFEKPSGKYKNKVCPGYELFLEKSALLVVVLSFNVSLRKYRGEKFSPKKTVVLLLESRVKGVSKSFPQFLKFCLEKKCDYIRDVDKSKNLVFAERSLYSRTLKENNEHFLLTLFDCFEINVVSVLQLLNRRVVCVEDLEALKVLFEVVVSLSLDKERWVGIEREGDSDQCVLGVDQVELAEKLLCLFDHERNGVFMKPLMSFIAVCVRRVCETDGMAEWVNLNSARTLLKKWALTLLAFSMPENDLTFRESVVESVKCLGRHTETIGLFEHNGKDGVECSIGFTFIVVLIRLLHDEDEDLRNTTARVVCQFLISSQKQNCLGAGMPYSEKMHPGMCLQSIFNYLVFYQTFPNGVNDLEQVQYTGAKEIVKLFEVVCVEKSENTFLERYFGSTISGNDSSTGKRSYNNLQSALFLKEKSNNYFEHIVDVELMSYCVWKLFETLPEELPTEMESYMRDRVSAVVKTCLAKLEILNNIYGANCALSCDTEICQSLYSCLLFLCVLTPHVSSSFPLEESFLSYLSQREFPFFPDIQRAIDLLTRYHNNRTSMRSSGIKTQVFRLLALTCAESSENFCKPWI